MTDALHKCERCGVVDGKVRCYNGRWVHEYAMDCDEEALVNCIAALKRQLAHERYLRDGMQDELLGKLAARDALLDRCAEIIDVLERLARKLAELKSVPVLQAIGEGALPYAIALLADIQARDKVTCPECERLRAAIPRVAQDYADYWCESTANYPHVRVWADYMHTNRSKRAMDGEG